MKALVTGASSGIGRDIARLLGKRGYDLILVARREQRLLELKKELGQNVRIICLDLSEEASCFSLYEQVKHENIDILVNSAGFGLFGMFDETDLFRELEMLNVNIRALHILTKLFLKDFKRNNAGYILNIASSAAFLPGPLLSSYYASKAYVLRLTEAVYEELRREKSRVCVCALCPGPVATEFDKTANVKFSIKGLKSIDVAKAAVDGMFRRKLVIVPGTRMKLARLFKKFVPEKQLLRIVYHLQKRKEG